MTQHKKREKKRRKHFRLFQEKYDTKYVKISLPPKKFCLAICSPPEEAPHPHHLEENSF